MHEAILLEEGLGISNFVESSYDQDSLLTSVFWISFTGIGFGLSSI